MVNYNVNIEIHKIKEAFEKVKEDVLELTYENIKLKEKILNLELKCMNCNKVESKANENKVIISKVKSVKKSKNKSNDDLTLIEGIGPKIKSILEKANIKTLDKLSNTTVEKLEVILKENSMQYHNPSTWPEQAELAKKGKFTELKIWQDKLKGGKIK